MNDLAKVSSSVRTGLANPNLYIYLLSPPLPPPAFLPKLLVPLTPASPSPFSAGSAIQSPTRPSLLCEAGELQSPC